MVKLCVIMAASILMAFGCVSSVSAVAGPAPQNIIITEVQPESNQSGTEELVVLYNPNASEVDVTGWQLEYRSAASTDESKWSTRATLSCQSPDGSNCRVVLPAKSSLMLASYTTEHEALNLTSGMATNGGQIRLNQPAFDDQPQVVHDMVGYGTAVVAEGGEAAIAPQKGVSIKRLTDNEGNSVDTDNNKHDFLLNMPNAPSGDPEPEEPGKGAGEQSYLPLVITELLPDPASPASDEDDEFIELYNPNAVAVSAKDYMLEAGTTWQYAYALPDIHIPAHNYVVFMATETNLTLSNSGTSVRLLDPTGKVINETVPYGTAKTGQSWILSDGQWRWSIQPTPGAENVFVEAPPKLVAITAKKSPKTTTKKAAATKAKKSASVKAAKAKKPKAQKQTAKSVEQAAQATKPEPNYWLIGAVAALAGGYALYEYRNDVFTKLRRLRELKKKDGG